MNLCLLRNEGVNVYNPPEDEVNIEQEHSSIDNIAKNIYTQVTEINFKKLKIYLQYYHLCFYFGNLPNNYIYKQILYFLPE